MRDSRDQHSKSRNRTQSAQAGVPDPTIRAAANLGSFGMRVAGAAANSIQQAAELSDDDKRQVEAVQAAHRTYQEDSINELSSGLDNLIGKQDNRAKYAKEIAWRNSAGRFNQELIERLPDYADDDVDTFIGKASTEFTAYARDLYGDDEEAYNGAVAEFNRQLPQVTSRQAQYYSSSLQARVVNDNVEQYTQEWDNILSTLNGVASTGDKYQAGVRQNTFFDDDYSIGKQASAVTRNQKALAIKRSLAADNTSMYMTAKEAGFIDKLDPQVANALEREMEASISRRTTAVGLTIDTHINDALETSDLSKIVEAREDLADWRDSGYGTEREMLQYEAQRRRLINTESSLIPKTTAKDKKQQDTLDVYSTMGDHVAYGGLKPTTELKKSAAQMHVMTVASKSLPNGIGGNNLSQEEAINVVLSEPQLFAESMRGAEFFEVSDEMQLTVQAILRDLPLMTDENGQMDSKTQAQINSISAYATTNEAMFEDMFGEDALVQLALYKANAGKAGSAYQQAVAEYNRNKNIPINMENMGLADTKMTKREYVLGALGQTDVSVPVSEYLLQKFDTGVRMYGTPEGGIRHAKHFLDNVDAEYKGTLVKDGKVYAKQALGGRDINDALDTLEQQVDSNGDTFLTEVLRASLPEGSTVQKFEDLDNMSITTNAVTGAVIISSASMLAPVMLQQDEIESLLAEADAQAQLYSDFENSLKARDRFANMYYMGQSKPQEYSYLTQDPNKPDAAKNASWAQYKKEAGRDAEATLTEYGILPPEGSTVVIPVGDLVELDEVAVPGISAAQHDNGAGVDESMIEPDTEVITRANVPTHTGVDVFGRKTLSEASREKLNRAVLTKYGISEREEAEMLAISGEAAELMRHEGMVPTVYRDSKNLLTWGVGFRLNDGQVASNGWKEGGVRFPKSVMLQEFKAHLATAKTAASRYLRMSGIENPSSEMVNIFTNIAYNHGESGLSEYTELSRALNNGNASQVLLAMRDSAWWKYYQGKTVDRANELVYRMGIEMQREGNWTWE